PATLPGNTPVGANGQPAQPRRRRPRPQTDPMRPGYRPLKQIARPIMSMTQMNEGDQTKAAAANRADNDGAVPVEALRHEFLSRGALSLPLVVTRRDLKELRHHVMRLQSKGKVDVLDDQQFTPPIRLHRRDPRAPPSGAGAHLEDDDTKEDVEESKERERLEIQKEERRKIREENSAKIAPSGTKKGPAFQKKTEQKYRPDDTPEAKKRQLLRYEETLPWHLEDFENKQTWVGTYESELSEAHVMLTTAYVNNRDVVQLAPMERWYKFNVKSKAKQTTGDDADKAMMKTEKTPSFLSNIESISRKREEALRQSRPTGMRTRVGGGADDEGRIRRPRLGDDDDMPTFKPEADRDDIDFNVEDDFADDEEGLNGLFEGEEADVKDAAERLKRDHLGAAAFDAHNEAELSRQEERERQEAEAARKLEKALRKSLIKREKDIRYDESDPEKNPYESESSDSDTDSETERQRAKEEEERKAAEQSGKPIEGDKVEGDKAASGASTKGSNTPSGSHKPIDMNKKKRPGSPNLSEASGNESSRKKHKKKHDKHSDGSRKSNLVNDVTKRGAASGSDSEMTDVGRQKKPKLKVRLGGSPSGSPSGSRAGSPAASQLNGSRASSPTTSSLSPQERLPTALEIYKELPFEGAPMTHLITVFKSRVDRNSTQMFIKLVKTVSTYDKVKQLLVPLPQMPSDEVVNAALKAGKPAPA
ncbi:hypothetical protein BDV95DRAFT_472123, partial [Massariosphaeria phaeospora]